MRILVYLLRRLLTAAPLIFGMTVVVFVVLRVIPGDPVAVIVGPFADDIARNSVRKSLNLDKPVYTQYVIFIKDAANGDLGRSFHTRNPVREDLGRRLPATMELVVLSLGVALLLGAPVAVFGAMRPGSIVDRVAILWSVLGVSIPVFFLALVLIQILFVQLSVAAAPIGRLDVGLLPPEKITGSYLLDSLLTGNWPVFKSAVEHVWLPVMTAGPLVASPVIKQLRSAMIRELQSDHVDFAELCGLTPMTVWRYAIRPALIPLVTISGILFGLMLGGLVLVEVIFSWPGLGSYGVDSILIADYPAIQGFVLLAAVIVVLIYFMVDLLYLMLDPRVQL